MRGRPMNENTKRMMALGVGESILIGGVTMRRLRTSRGHLLKHGVKVKMRSKSNGVRVERIA